VSPTRFSWAKATADLAETQQQGKVLLVVTLRHTSITKCLDVEVAAQDRLVKPHRFGSLAVEVDIRAEGRVQGDGEYKRRGPSFERTR